MIKDLSNLSLHLKKAGFLSESIYVNNIIKKFSEKKMIVLKQRMI